VLGALRELVPGADLLYLADAAHVPYGDRSPAELAELMFACVRILERAGATSLVMGCNTSCAVAADLGWPATTLEIFDLIGAAADAVAALEPRTVGVIATVATTRSGAYGRALRARIPGVVVREVAAPELVPLVEAGRLDGADVRAAVAEACGALGAVDGVVLGCTHYPLLDARFAEALGPSVARIDPARAQARRVAGRVAARDAAGSGTTRYLTTGALAPFRAAVERIVGLQPLARFASADSLFASESDESRFGRSDSNESEQSKEDEHAARAERGSGDDLQRRVLA